MESIDLYIEFVTNEIEKYKGYTNLVRHSEVPPYIINKALAEYTNTSLTLHSEYQRIKSEHIKLLDEYQKWWDKVFLDAKYKLNPLSLSSGKWSSVKEIEATARVDNEEEYGKWREKLRNFELKISFYKRLIDSWKNHKDILINLAQNTRIEMRNLGIQDQANKKTSRTLKQ